ncbi:diguanylate cyclase [Pseudomonas mosselii]|nr:diguanylate cyclase [Pseudomonas mosselii]
MEQMKSPVGAGLPANTGKAGAKHRRAFFAGKPAPTGWGGGFDVVV